MAFAMKTKWLACYMVFHVHTVYPLDKINGHFLDKSKVEKGCDNYPEILKIHERNLREICFL